MISLSLFKATSTQFTLQRFLSTTFLYLKQPLLGTFISTTYHLIGPKYVEEVRQLFPRFADEN